MLCSSANHRIILLIALVCAPILYVTRLLHLIEAHAIVQNDGQPESVSSKFVSSPMHDDTQKCSADSIIQDSYNRWYRPFVEQCPKGKNETECMIDYLKKTEPSSLPWWFHSLIKLTAENPKPSGVWHYFQFSRPHLQLCAIEKVAITQWRKIYKIFTGKVIPREPWHDVPGLDKKIPRAVFLRDPLERFLSGYLNKCVDQPKEGFCEPNFIYKPPNAYASRLDKKHHFESFVASIPFGWNHHFVPQAFFCQGLYRTLEDFDFVGNMDSHVFVHDLKRFQKQFPGAVSNAIQTVYNLDADEAGDFRAVLENTHAGHFTNAPKQVVEYYSAESVRQVLKYLAIDYVTLNLTVPEWVDEILRKDCQMSEAGR